MPLLVFWTTQESETQQPHVFKCPGKFKAPDFSILPPQTTLSCSTSAEVVYFLEQVFTDMRYKTELMLEELEHDTKQ